jgi:hypothetical protein
MDSEWKRGVEASMMSLRDGQDGTLKVLRALLLKLDSPRSDQHSNIGVLQADVLQPLSSDLVANDDPHRMAASPGHGVSLPNAATHNSLVFAVHNPRGQDRQRTGVHSIGPVQEDVNMEIDVLQPSPEEKTMHLSSEVHLDIHQTSDGEDSEFQAPIQLKKRTKRACVEMRATSPKKNSILKKRVKKGIATTEVPPITASNLGRLEARDTFDPVAVGKPCWILHPLHPQVAIRYGKTSPTWKTKGQQLAGCCVHGEQMVQVHWTFRESVPLIFCELQRQPFRLLDEAIVPTSGSGVYVKWDTWYLIRTKDIGDHGTCS